MAAPLRRPYAARRPRAERRSQLLDAALTVVDRDGFGGLSVESVAREADLAKTVVYSAFGGLPGLLGGLLDREQDRVIDDLAGALPRLPLEGEPAEVLEHGVSELLRRVQARPETWRLILLPREGAPPVVREAVDEHRLRLLEQLHPVVRWGLDHLGAGHLDPELTSHALIASIEQAARLTLTDPARFSPQRMARFAVDVLGTMAARRAPA